LAVQGAVQELQTAALPPSAQRFRRTDGEQPFTRGALRPVNSAPLTRPVVTSSASPSASAFEGNTIKRTSTPLALRILDEAGGYGKGPFHGAEQ
jgi:hypothetical protein